VNTLAKFSDIIGERLETTIEEEKFLFHKSIIKVKRYSE
jgi:hypothetical protein